MLPILFGFVKNSSLDKLSQGNRVSIGSTEGDSLDGVSAKFPHFHNSNSFRTFGFDTFLTQVNHQSGKEKKGSVLGRFLGRKKVNTWVDACLGKLANIASQLLSVFQDRIQNQENYLWSIWVCYADNLRLSCTPCDFKLYHPNFLNPLLYKCSGRNTRWKVTKYFRIWWNTRRHELACILRF